MLKEISHHPNRFFEILPKDWQESIIPYWQELKEDAKIYIIEDDQEILVGGMVFSSMIPEMNKYAEEALSWYAKDYLYIGYLWVSEKNRGKNWGSRWLEELRTLDKNQKYWLTIEEEGLKGFYLKNNFKHIKRLEYDGLKEELFAD
ncbi:GNAT family N-acetyltransferase [Namhaeicola litoreus]|uniref:GNAT family N-acetyltransferase n=1 Tax=Namhaeicola litoreus TaxID=1052145 RepID=A0ABW3Y567_9FLAO